MARDRDETTLPKWAQERVGELRADAEYCRQAMARMQSAHSLLGGRTEWFTISGPPENAIDGRDIYRLWFLSNEGAHPACALRKGDVLMVGRRDPVEFKP